MRVRDSTKISDGRILDMAPDIRTICPHSIIVIGPQRYNELYVKILNLNRLLAWGHAKALETFLENGLCRRAADPFGDERLILNALQEGGGHNYMRTTGRVRSGSDRRLYRGPRRIPPTITTPLGRDRHDVAQRGHRQPLNWPDV